MREHNLGNNLLLCEEHLRLALSILAQRQGCRTPHGKTSRWPRLVPPHRALCIESRHGYFFFERRNPILSFNWLDHCKLMKVWLLLWSRLWRQMLIHTDFSFRSRVPVQNNLRIPQCTCTSYTFSSLNLLNSISNIWARTDRLSSWSPASHRARAFHSPTESPANLILSALAFAFASLRTFPVL